LKTPTWEKDPVGFFLQKLQAFGRTGLLIILALILVSLRAKVHLR
jgi:hypothetical protein